MKALLLVLALAATASANVWRHAIEQGSPDVHQDVYDAEMRDGDSLTLQATSQSSSRDNVRTLVNQAAMSYRKASEAKPEMAEPHYKLGRLLYSFYFECTDAVVLQVHPSLLCDDQRRFDAVHARQIIAAWDAFEARAPLDPRVSVERNNAGIDSDFNLLFHRAVLHTRLAGEKDVKAPEATAELQAATKDYEKILARTDAPDETILSNLAETYMMLGNLDLSIDTYRQALRNNRNTETMYGLAVALDRDERSDQAKDVILAQGMQSLTEFQKRVSGNITFFVPSGEENYYYALAFEAFGLNDSAIAYWKLYIKSNAHPEYQPRARAHLAPLLRAQTRKSVNIETPWRDFIP
ncbi:MAG: tetratricopeptide repeat protein [Kofleriaceae bacterium]